MWKSAYHFIDDSLVGVEIEGQSWVAGRMVRCFAQTVWLGFTYFSMRTREALLTVFVRTRP